MNKEILQISFQHGQNHKTKFGKWFYNKIWFKFWFIFRPKMLSKFFGLFISKETKRKLLEEIEIQFVISEGDKEFIELSKKLGQEIAKELKIPIDKFDKIPE